MGSFLRRLIAQLGMTGLVIVFAALVFGVIAGGVIVHRLEASPAVGQEAQKGDNSAQPGENSAQKGKNSSQQGESSGQQGDASDQKDEGQSGSSSHATGSRTTEPPNVQEGD
jgi:hypothetical protein